MTAAVLGMLAGAAFVLWRHTRGDRDADGCSVSDDWLRAHKRSRRVEYHGPRIQWPIDKLANENGMDQRGACRRRG